MESGNQNQTRKEELEGLVGKLKRERLVGLAKTAGYSILPFAISGGIMGLTVATVYAFENPEIKASLNMGIPLILGGIAGGCYRDYLESFRYILDNNKYRKIIIDEYQKELSQLEQ